MERDRSQLEKFKEAARDLECDDDERHFKERLGKLVKAKAVDNRGEYDEPKTKGKARPRN